MWRELVALAQICVDEFTSTMARTNKAVGADVADANGKCPELLEQIAVPVRVLEGESALKRFSRLVQIELR